MTEVVALTHADEGIARREGLQRFSRETIVASVVRHLEHLDRHKAESVRSALQRCPLGIASQKRIKPATLDV